MENRSDILKFIKFFSVGLLFIAIGASLPPIIFYDKIKLDEPLFVTECLKIWFEAVVIAFIVEGVARYQEVKKRNRHDIEEISNKAIFFIDECLLNLEMANKSNQPDVFKKSSSNASLCWDLVESFFTDKIYFNLINKRAAIDIFYYHNEIVSSGLLNHLSNYFKHYDYLDENKIKFVCSSLNNIKKHLNKSLYENKIR